jgi:hypothetical protein
MYVYEQCIDGEKHMHMDQKIAWMCIHIFGDVYMCVFVGIYI